jgi:glucose/arabinose dehydrogenase
MSQQRATSGRSRFVLAAAGLGALTLAAGLLSHEARAGQGLRAVEVGSFDAPVYAENAPGARNLLFIVEQGGAIEVMRKRRTLSRPFIDLSRIVSYEGERGLLSIAFAPDYERTRRFYVYFTNTDGDIEVDEFKRSRRSPVRASSRSRRKVIVIPHPGAANHNGGTLAFGPGDLLYLATGDGGGSGDGFDNARHTDNLLGKLLRIDPRRGESRPYRIPNGNPYVGRAGEDEIFAYGLRNPYRWSFDGDVLAVGDVGQGDVEEINMGTVDAIRGANFGWPEFEGDEPFDPERPGADPARPPIHTYARDGGNCAVTGGGVVRDPGLPSLRGRYLYADFCEGVLRSFRPNLAAGAAEDEGPIGITLPSPTSFVEGARGQLYVTSHDGGLFRLEQ